MSGNQNNVIIDEVKKLIENVNKMINLHEEVMDILMNYYSSHNYESIMEFKKKASKKVKEALAMTEHAIKLAKGDKKKAKTSRTIGGSSGRSRKSRVKKSTVQYEIDDILTGGYWKEMKKKK